MRSQSRITTQSSPADTFVSTTLQAKLTPSAPQASISGPTPELNSVGTVVLVQVTPGSPIPQGHLGDVTVVVTAHKKRYLSVMSSVMSNTTNVIIFRDEVKCGDMSGNDENRSCVAVFVCDVICVSSTRYVIIFQGRSKVRLYARQERKPELCILYIRVYNAETAQS